MEHKGSCWPSEREVPVEKQWQSESEGTEGGGGKGTQMTRYGELFQDTGYETKGDR